MAAKATEFLLPAVRFAGHVLASAVGFTILAVVSLVPIYAVKILVGFGGTKELVAFFQWVEIGVLYLDAAAYIVTVLIWTVVFLIEEVQAARKAIGW